MARSIFLFFTVIFLSVFPIVSQATEVNRLLQLVDYVGVDYQKSVSAGKVTNAGEYAEMVEFSATIGMLTQELTDPPAPAILTQQVGRLKQLVEAKAPADQVATLGNNIRAILIKTYGLATAPDHVPDIPHGRQLYQANCSACHGAQGFGDGPLARGLEPQPTNFHDVVRYGKRSLFGLFNTITYGVEGTAMSGFAALTKRERWDLAAYIGQLAVPADAAQRGKAIWQQIKGHPDAVTPGSFTTLSPDDAARAWPGGRDLMAYLRQVPGALFTAAPSPVTYALEKLRASYDAYRQGQGKLAYRDAVTSYLEGFELVEVNLAALDPALKSVTEKAMARYRNSIRKGDALPGITSQYQGLLSLLQQAQSRLEEKSSLTPTAAFVASAIILLREGLEALLVLIALSAFLIKTGRRDAMPYLHYGWISALVLGGITWFVSERILQISGATREVTEGVAALVASATLLFVGFWLHNKTTAAGWQKFIQGSVQSALKGGTLWGLAGLSFITVYREVFETILFYQALWAQADGHSANAVIAGFVAGSLTLVASAWLAIKYSVRLPLQQFFGATGVLLLILSFVFAGKGVAALQEAGKIPQTLIQFPAIDWLGIFPSSEGLLLQSVIVIIAVWLYFKGRHNLPEK